MGDNVRALGERGKIPKEGKKKVSETLQGEKTHIGQKMPQERIPGT